MPEIDVAVVAAAAVAAFVLSGAWYAVLSPTPTEAEPVPPWTYGVELVRNVVVATVITGLVTETGTTTWPAGIALGLALWTGFPLVLWVGAVVHEKTPIPTAALHAGDWLLKLPLIATLATLWS